MPRKKKVELNEINDTNVNIIKNLDVETKKESNKEGTPIGKNMQNDKKPHPKRVSKSSKNISVEDKQENLNPNRKPNPNQEKTENLNPNRKPNPNQEKTENVNPNRKPNPNQEKTENVNPNPTQINTDKASKPIKQTQVEKKKLTINKSKLLTATQLKNPQITKFLDKLENYIKNVLYIESGHKVLIAMSGGVDSSVMFDAFALIAEKLNFTIYALHFNHKLRGLSSDRDERLVATMSKDYNVQYFNAIGNVKQFAEKNSLSIEYAARQLRYNFFEKIARTLNANFVATAHTADDSAETFFLNLLRGSGLTGLSGIPSKRQLIKNVMMVRPFLNFRKSELIEYAKLRKLKWFEDETNSLLNYTRNKIRLSLLPHLEEFNPSIIETINQTAHLIHGADRIIRELVKKSYPVVLEDGSQDKFSVKIPMLLANEKFLQGEIIQYLWIKYFRMQPLSMQTVERILQLIDSQTGAICEINSMFIVLRDRNHLVFSKRQYDDNIKLLISVPGNYFIGKYKIEFTEIPKSDVKYDDNPNIEYFDASAFQSFIEIRNWHDGDSFQPLGMTGEMKISDYLINEKVPLIDKTSILVLTNKVEIIWIIGKRISDKFKVKKNTKMVIKATLIKNDRK